MKSFSTGIMFLEGAFSPFQHAHNGLHMVIASGEDAGEDSSRATASVMMASELAASPPIISTIMNNLRAWKVAGSWLIYLYV